MKPRIPTADTIKALFPNACREPMEGDPAPGAYCVGGAVMQYFGYDESFDFPIGAEIGFCLQRQNPNLDDVTATYLGNMVTMCNDQGEFDRAWKFVDEGLRHGYE